MARECAFCGSSKDLTREHISPAGVISECEGSLVSLTDKSGSYFRSDLVVKDVFVSCNTGALSKLNKDLDSTLKRITTYAANLVI